jgi:hypothetical protein
MLANHGSADLKISGVRTSGDFQIQSNQCPATISPGAQCEIDVTFTPTASGTRSGALTITGNAANSPQSVPLTGSGVQPAVTFSPASLNFPGVVINNASKIQTVTVTNSGTGVLNIVNLATIGPFKHKSDCSSTLNAGASCSISIVFVPTTIGTQRGGIFLKDNAPGSPQSVLLTGTATALQVVPTTGIVFVDQPIGTTSLAKNVTITNKGPIAVNFSQVAIIGPNAADFQQSNTCGTSIVSGASCSIKVRFKPTATGARCATVSITDDGGASPQQVPLSGNGT